MTSASLRSDANNKPRVHAIFCEAMEVPLPMSDTGYRNATHKGPQAADLDTTAPLPAPCRPLLLRLPTKSNAATMDQASQWTPNLPRATLHPVLTDVGDSKESITVETVSRYLLSMDNNYDC